ncbi:transcriptional regulator [Escherichia coli]|nr:transcriptional regulator [Escherichia coli]
MQTETLSSGCMSEYYFWLMVEISPIHSEKVIYALRDFLVMGYTRKEACERNEVSQSYLSCALKRFQIINRNVVKMVRFYIKSELSAED